MNAHPVVTVLVASSDENYIDCLRELSSNVHHLPKPFQNGLFDPNGMRRQFLVVHDDSSGSKCNEQEIIVKMKERFPNQACAVLRLNSGGTEVEEDESLWRDYRLFPTPIQSPFRDKRKPIGMLLSSRDKLAVRRFVATLLADGVLPALERRIYHLNGVVNNAKRGVKNMFKTLWRKPKDAPSSGGGYNVSAYQTTKTPSSPSSSQFEIKYSHDTIESQIRLLGDSLFLVKDYENALSMYRLVKDDYKSDKSTLHYASLQEKMAFCYYLLDAARYARDIQTTIESSLYSYTRLAPLSSSSTTSPRTTPWTKYATRLCLTLSTFPPLQSFSHSDIADLLASTSSHETPHGAAILLERAACHYAAADMTRKCAFHALMAGHMYRSAGMEEHGMRCFTSALGLYQISRWGDLVQHLDSALAAQAYALGRLRVCVVLYCVLLGGKRRGVVKGGVRSQGRFIQHLMDVCRRSPWEGVKAVAVMSEKTKQIETLGGGGSSASSSSSVLEICNLNLPRVWEEKVIVEGGDEWRYGPEMDTCDLHHSTDTDKNNNSNNKNNINHSSNPQNTNATTQSQQRQLWKDLTISFEAEITAKPPNDTAAVLKQISKERRHLEKISASLARNPHKSGVYPLFGPASRSRMEPIRISFTAVNPLAVQLQFTQLQLVATLEPAGDAEGIGGFIGKNDVAENVKPLSSSQHQKQPWRFLSLPNVDFDVPHFYQNLPNDNTTQEASPSEPFFVVDKQALVIEPNTTQKVTLTLTPLIKGNLKILGYRAKLFNEIWLYHKFDISGPLLQDTALHRANRVRGESYLLQSTVLDDMPLLDVTLRNVPSVVLQGQISKITIGLTNRGTAPAGTIYLKANLPWLALDTDNDTLGAVSTVMPSSGTSPTYTAPTSHCVGPTGTLMKLSLKKPLAPGVTTEVDLHFRPTGGGRQDLFLLFRYQNMNDLSSKKALRVRYTRQSIGIAVYPSLTMTASLMPSYWSRSEHVLSVEISNYRSDACRNLNVGLGSVIVASRH
eukprot:CAMPEP_0172484228 /NCGR_PEP_ID=MMETSP1066-20121228/11600_1 /TAXON_ID=671091 /ORGANISM="Coscinodiscus wailesii, Strain CCMP2513" /LENGTH=1011 /DNA_ID=CAMNT_0013248591 /DNA_START=206 /DNA_END=3238 /DNA_ORIENTATION=+